MTKYNHDLAIQLANFTHSFIPYLNFSTDFSDCFLSNDQNNRKNDQRIIINLYENIKRSTPEADNSYWIARSWILLTWQPLYIAFVSIYGLNHLPNLKDFKQRQHEGTMQGINLLSNEFIVGETEFLIKQTAKVLDNSFEYYRQLLDEVYRCRPRFSQALLSDMILDALIELKVHSPELLAPEYILEQAHLWLDAFSLPMAKKATFMLSPTSKEVIHIRESCCFVYKTESGKLCANCPRIKK